MLYDGYWWFTEDDGEICLGTEPNTLASMVIATGVFVREGHGLCRHITYEERMLEKMIRNEMVEEDERGPEEAPAASVVELALQTFEEYLGDEALERLVELRHQDEDDDD